MSIDLLCLDDDLLPFIARAESMGRRDYHDRVDIKDGYYKFKHSGATVDELIAYCTGWSNEQARSILKADDMTSEALD